MSDLKSKIENVLNAIVIPELGLMVESTRWLHTVQLDASVLSVRFVCDMPCAIFDQPLRDKIQQALAKFELTAVHIEIISQIRSHLRLAEQSLKSAAKNIIAVASTKGGVGKTTTALHIAWMLQAWGATVGLLDADIYGPSLPVCLGHTQAPNVVDKQWQPIKIHGLETMSIGYLVDSTAPMIWRGPMVAKGLQQLFGQTNWSKLDYLVVDLPPGTGDIQLTLAQKIPLTGVLMVTTPQQLACADVRKGIEMFQKVTVPILGIVENMSYYVCPHCQHSAALFGQGGGQALSKAYQIPWLGDIPLEPQLVTLQEQGIIPIAEQMPILQDRYRNLVAALLKQIIQLPVNYQSIMPNVVIQHESPTA